MTIAAIASSNYAAAPAALPPKIMKKIDEAAQSFESMFMSQMMQFIWAGDSQADETFGGGHGEEMWRGMLTQEFGKLSSEGQSLGLAGSVRDQMIRLQQAQMTPRSEPQVHEIAPTQNTAQNTVQETAHDPA